MTNRRTILVMMCLVSIKKKTIKELTNRIPHGIREGYS